MSDDKLESAPHQWGFKKGVYKLEPMTFNLMHFRALRPRKEVVAFLNAQFDDGGEPPEAKKKHRKHWTSGVTRLAAWHYGRCELRELLDFLYGGPPRDESEML